MDVPWWVDHQSVEVGGTGRGMNELREVEALQVTVDPLSPATIAQALDAELALPREVDLERFEFSSELALGFGLASVGLCALHLVE